MPRTGWSPRTVPYGADQTVYLVVDRFTSGSVYRETEIERTDLETIINDFLTGQFNDPIRVIAFNTLEHWSDDVSDDIAREIQTRCDMKGERVPEYLVDFVNSYVGPIRQLSLRLALPCVRRRCYVRRFDVASARTVDPHYAGLKDAAVKGAAL